MDITINDVISEFKTVAEVRALIVLNGLGRHPVTREDYDKAILHCACTSPYVGPSEHADWRLFTVECGEDFNNVHLPQWLVDTALQFVTDDELDNIINDVPIENWVTGLVTMAQNVPEGYVNPDAIALCEGIEEAGKTVPEEDRVKVQKAVKDKVARVRTQKAAIANGEAPPENSRDIRVAIIGL